MTVAPRNRPGRMFARPMLRYLDALGHYAGDRLADLLSRRQLIRALADGEDPRTQSSREVYAVPATRMPTDDPVAATLRY